jgi:uncharacterized delta-60 repeat protein
MNQKIASYFRLLTKHIVALLALTLLLTPKFSSAQTAGTLDPTFGTGGRVTTFFGGDGLNGDDAYSVVVQTNGKLVVAGSTTNLDDTVDFALARYNSNGTLDGTFGTGGKVKTNFADFDYVRALALQADGKIVAAGFTLVNFMPRFALARYNTNGALDATFGTGGKVITGFGGPAEVLGVAIQSDGKIVATGFAHVNTDFDFALARYNSNGTLDTTFGTGGKKTTAFGTPSIAQGNAISVQRDGKIVVAGLTVVNNFANFALARYNTNGTLDGTFGTGGKLVTDFGADDRAFSVALQTDGKIVAAGMTGANFALARYNTNGTLDGTFGTGGKVITDIAGGLNDIALGVAIRQDGKIVAVGRAVVSGRTAFAVARYNSNGILDTSFGNGGKVTTSFVGSLGDQAFSVAIQPDGKAVVAGSAVVNLNTQFALARYQ